MTQPLTVAAPDEVFGLFVATSPHVLRIPKRIAIYSCVGQTDVAVGSMGMDTRIDRIDRALNFVARGDFAQRHLIGFGVEMPGF